MGMGGPTSPASRRCHCALQGARHHATSFSSSVNAVNGVRDKAQGPMRLYPFGFFYNWLAILEFWDNFFALLAPNSVQRTDPQNQQKAYLITVVLSNLLKNPPPLLNILYTKSETATDTSS